MSYLPVFGACVVAIMLHTSALEQRSAWWVSIFALGSAASSLYGWLAGTGRSGSLRVCGQCSLCVAGGCDDDNKVQQDASVVEGKVNKLKFTKKMATAGRDFPCCASGFSMPCNLLL